MELSPETTQAPAGWTRPPAPREVLDIVHWALRNSPRLTDGKWPLAATFRRQVKAPVTVSHAVAELCESVAYQTALPFIVASVPPTVKRYDTVDGIAVLPCDPPAMIPISTASHDDTQLRWDDDAYPCASGKQCAAARLCGAPGPLPFYVPSGVPRSTYEQPAFCLLCIRADAAAVAAVYSRVVRSAERQLGRAAVALPPFQNLVNCPDGYSERSLGIRPNQHIFAPISVVGPHDLPVAVDSKGVNFVDQSRLKHTAADFRNGAQRSLSIPLRA